MCISYFKFVQKTIIAIIEIIEVSKKYKMDIL